MDGARVTMTEDQRARLGLIDDHQRIYLESGGRQGHIFDARGLGGNILLTTLLLETVGRKSGERRVAALNYGDIGGEVAIIASKGGADVHPAWYLNLREMDEVTFQIATQAFRATWREAGGEEYDRLWDFMAMSFAPYAKYRNGTARRIPLVMLKAIGPADVLQP